MYGFEPSVLIPLTLRTPCRAESVLDASRIRQAWRSDCSSAQAPQCDEWPRTHCVESECRNRSIDHVSVSLFVDDVAVEEFVEPVKRLWSLLSWRDADCE